MHASILLAHEHLGGLLATKVGASVGEFAILGVALENVAFDDRLRSLWKSDEVVYGAGWGWGRWWVEAGMGRVGLSARVVHVPGGIGVHDE